ncbi:MAG: hypothetical protein GX644_12845 [Limnobacter sp.]|nr:hypothetical protein [Limnobacter sp.]
MLALWQENGWAQDLPSGCHCFAPIAGNFANECKQGGLAGVSGLSIDSIQCPVAAFRAAGFDKKKNCIEA